jgi:hypothetical protein
MVCPNCGNVSDGKRFCTQCGVVLASPLAPTAPASGGAKPPAAVSSLSTSGALTGRTLDQKYYLESKLGVGGMGTVYRADRLLIGDRVAVKVLHPDQMADPQAVERFRREARRAFRRHQLRRNPGGAARIGIVRSSFCAMRLKNMAGIRHVPHSTSISHAAP